MKKVIVIGAGAAGLASAIRLQYLGYQVHLYDKNDRVGGKMHQIKQQGFTFDVGPTIVMMPEIYREVFEYTGVDPDRYIPMEKVDPMLNLNFDDGTSIPFSSDLTQLIPTLEKMSEQETAGFLKFIADIYERYIIAKDSFLTRSFRKPTDFYNPKMLLEGLKLKTFNDAYSSISKFVKNENLRKALAFQTLYIGISPYQGPSLYTIIPMIELLYGVWFIKDGMYGMAKAMERRFIELGGILHLNSEIKEICFENGRATGVKIANNQMISADYIICNADFPYAMKHLIPNETDRGKYTNQKIDKMEYSCSCFVLYLGLDKKYPKEILHTIRFTEDFEKNIDEIFEEGILPTDPSFYIYLPSQKQADLAPEGHEAMYVLVPVPELSKFDQWNEKIISQYRQKVLDLIVEKTNFKDLKEHIVFEEIYTPERFKTHFNAYYGATFGLKPTLTQSNYYRPHNKFDYAEGLYFCGSSTHPGAGVPIVLQSAKLAVEELLKDDHANL